MDECQGQTLLSARFKGSAGSGWQKSGDNPPSFALQDVTSKCQSPESTNWPASPAPCLCTQELNLSSAQGLRLFLAMLGECWAPVQLQECLVWVLSS